MTKMTGNTIPPIPIAYKARDISRHALAGTTPNEDSPLGPLAEVQILRTYVCELLRKNQELRFALSGLTSADVDGCEG